MRDFMSDIEDFHVKFGLEHDGTPIQIPPDLAQFRADFMQEELNEYIEAYHKHDLEGQFDALIDLVYVALGTAYLSGFKFNEGWQRVHNANMTKVRVDREENSKRSSSYDIVKPHGWQPPILGDLL